MVQRFNSVTDHLPVSGTAHVQQLAGGIDRYSRFQLAQVKSDHPLGVVS